MKKEMEYVYNTQKEISLLKYTDALLGWDQRVCMPNDGGLSRAEQNAFISTEIHKRIISDKLFNSTKELMKKNLTGMDKIVVNRLYKDLVISRKLPLELVEDMSRTVSLAHNAWREAREKNNFNLFKPYLKKIVELKRKEAKYLDIGGHIYNGLFNNYEEGMTVEKIRPLLDKLKYNLIELLNEIKDSKEYNKKFEFLNKFPIDGERKAAEELKKVLGLKENNSRMDLSAHPFTTSTGIDDTRITYRFTKNPMGSFLSVAHETGHAFYELGLPKKYKYTAVYDGTSLGMHESQSRFWENMICRNKIFWKYFYPKYKNEFKQLKKVNLDEWYKAINQVKPGLIRTESDEISYCLHIILRFELELGLIDGSIKVEDLPKIWNKMMKEYLGVDVKKDSDGVLQDVHWSGGSIGYFATYAIGSIYAAQLYEKMIEEHPEYEKEIEKGNFKNILNWLNKNVHVYGREKTAEEIVKNICGEGLNPDIYIKYLRRKYLDIYK